MYEADEDAVYEAEYTIDLSKLEPTVAFPHLPENTKTMNEISQEIDDRPGCNKDNVPMEK